MLDTDSPLVGLATAWPPTKTDLYPYTMHEQKPAYVIVLQHNQRHNNICICFFDRVIYCLFRCRRSLDPEFHAERISST